MSSCDSQDRIGRAAQITQEVSDSLEWFLRKGWIGAKLRKQTAVGLHYVWYWRFRSSELRQDELNRPSDQCQAVLGQWQRQTKFSKDRAVALQNQSATINERSIKIETISFKISGYCFVGCFDLRY